MTPTSKWSPSTSIAEIAPDSWQQSELVFKPRTLMYGIYKLLFYSRMWDANDADPLFTRVLPFMKVHGMIIVDYPIICLFSYTSLVMHNGIFIIVGYVHVYRGRTIST